MTRKKIDALPLKRVRITVDKDIQDLIKQLRDNGIDPNEALRRELRKEAQKSAARVSAKHSTKTGAAKVCFFKNRCGTKSGDKAKARKAVAQA